MTNVTAPAWLALNPADETPIHKQIEDQIRLAIARGLLPADQRLPTVRALAQSAGVHPNTVARAYSALARDGVLAARPGKGTFVARERGDPGLEAEREARLNSIVVKAVVEALSLGFSPEQVEAAFILRMARIRQEALPDGSGAPTQAKPGPGLVIMGSHDIALDLLASHVRGLAGVELTSTHTGSLGGLIALARGEAHVAGCHLLDEDSGEYNVPFVRRVLAGVPTQLVTLVGRTQGLLVAKGNPKRILELKDVAREDVTLVNRQRGSGTRVLMDYLLRKLGLDPRCLKGYEAEVDTHTAVAAAVASGQADVGLGILAAAKALDLDFVPLREERYDLVVPEAVRDQPEVKALLAALRSTEFKDSVKQLGGYDTSQTGVVVSELD